MSRKIVAADPRGFITRNEFQARLCMGHSTFYRHLREGKFSVTKHGGRTLIPIAEYDRYVASLPVVGCSQASEGPSARISSL